MGQIIQFPVSPEVEIFESQAALKSAIRQMLGACNGIVNGHTIPEEAEIGRLYVMLDEIKVLVACLQVRQ